MKRLYYIFFLLSFLASPLKADTLDYWHVYFNKVKLKEFNMNEYGRQEIVLKKSKIKPADFITVKYFRDTPCSNCITYLTFENGKHHEIDRATGLGTFNPITISLNKLILSKITYIEVFYFEDNIKRRAEKKLLFRIKIE